MTDQEIEQFIERSFEKNYEMLRLEGGHALAPDAKEAALLQAKLYWRKLRNIAESITDTEVKLNLPGQTTPKGRKFGIDGVVDIVRENDRTVMYDIKTHDVDVVRANQKLYERQLKLYAHIWQNLRGLTLDGTAIIATAFPDSLREAMASMDDVRTAKELSRWNPLIEVPLEASNVSDIVQQFATVVDRIEDKEFAPPQKDVLATPLGDGKTLFATRVCLDCDARFSCDAYRSYALGGGRTDHLLRRYFADTGSDLSREAWLTAAAAESVPEN